MNILKYRALLCVLEQGSFSKAAEKLDYTQSGLTHMMNSLEEEVGLPLIERGYFGVRPTEAGEALLPLIREMLEKADALQAQIDKRLFTVRRIVRIGAFSSIALHWLPEVLERFKRECPDYIAEVRLGGVDDLYRSLQTGENDLIFASAVKDAPCRFIPLCEDKMYALLPPGEPPPPGDSYPISRFTGKDFLMPYLGFDKDVREAFDTFGVKPNIISAYVDDPAVISMVEHRVAATILSGLILKNRVSTAVIRPIDPPFYRTLGMAVAKNKALTPPLSRFMKIAEEVAKNFVI